MKCNARGFPRHELGPSSYPTPTWKSRREPAGQELCTTLPSSGASQWGRWKFDVSATVLQEDSLTLASVGTVGVQVMGTNISNVSVLHSLVIERTLNGGGGVGHWAALCKRSSKRKRGIKKKYNIRQI